jgi:hypothetical protein
MLASSCFRTFPFLRKLIFAQTDFPTCEEYGTNFCNHSRNSTQKRSFGLMTAGIGIAEKRNDLGVSLFSTSLAAVAILTY